MFGVNIRSVSDNLNILNDHFNDFVLFMHFTLFSFYFFFLVSPPTFRMDICRWSVLGPNESISFRWVIIVMVYMATIILCLTSDSFDERFYGITNNMNTNYSTMIATREMVTICTFTLSQFSRVVLHILNSYFFFYSYYDRKIAAF